MGVLSGIARVGKSLFIETTSQFVEYDDDKTLENTLVDSVKNGFSKINAKDLLGTSMNIGKKARDYSKKIDDSVRLSTSDKTDFRNDTTMENASIHVETKPAGELDNHRRTPGGRVRGQK